MRAALDLDLARAHLGAGDAETAEIHLRRAESLLIEHSGFDAPGLADVEEVLGAAIAQRGRFEEAEDHYRRALLLAARRNPAPDDRARRLARIAEALIAQSRPREAALYIRRSVAEAGASLEAGDLRWAQIHAARARLHVAQARYHDAASAQLAALAIEQRERHPDDPRLRARLVAVGEALLVRGRYEEALQYLERARAVDARRTEKVDAAAAISLARALGRVHRERGAYDAAETVLREALERAAVDDDLQPGVEAMLHGDLASVLAVRGRYEEARLEYAVVAKYIERASGPDAPLLAGYVASAASLDEASGDYAAAEAARRRAVELAEGYYGRFHPAVADRIADLADYLLSRDDDGAAEALYREALEIDEAYFGSHHPRVADRLVDLGRALAGRDRGLQIVERLFRRALTIDHAALGADHPEVARRQRLIGHVRLIQGRADEALAIFEQTLAIDEKVYGANHLSVASDLAALGGAAAAKGDHDRARGAYERAYAIQKAVYGEDHVALAPVMNRLAGAALRQGDPARAERLTRQAMKLQRLDGGDDGPDEFGLGVVLWQQGRTREAQAMFDKSIRAVSQTTDAGRTRVAAPCPRQPTRGGREWPKCAWPSRSSC